MDNKQQMKKKLMYKIISLIYKLFGYCERCDTVSNKDIKRRRLNTKYQDDKSNYMTSCKDCYDEVCEYYEELQRDYYTSRF